MTLAATSVAISAVTSAMTFAAISVKICYLLVTVEYRVVLVLILNPESA